jgi:hypothetical protein
MPSGTVAGGTHRQVGSRERLTEPSNEAARRLWRPETSPKNPGAVIWPKGHGCLAKVARLYARAAYPTRPTPPGADPDPRLGHKLRGPAGGCQVGHQLLELLLPRFGIGAQNR